MFQNNNEVGKKISILKKYLGLLTVCPYTRIIFLAGSIAGGNPKPESDIDLIIISEHKRVWLNRLFLELATFLIGQRRNTKKIKNRFCFNMFLSNDNSLLPHQDLVGASFYKNLKPVWGSELEIKKFWQTNSWLKNFCDFNFENNKIFYRDEKFLNRIIFYVEKILDHTGLGWLMEKVSYKIQTAYLKRKFNQAVVDKNSQDFDFNITPRLIAYHFPVSNHALELRKYKEKVKLYSTVENSPLK